MLMPQYSTSRLVDRLVEAGFVERKICPVDGRGQFAAITPAGRNMQKRMWETYAAAIERHVGSKLSCKEAAGLRDLLGSSPAGAATCAHAFIVLANIALSGGPCLRSRPFSAGTLNGPRPSRHDADRNARRAGRVVRRAAASRRRNSASAPSTRNSPSPWTTTGRCPMPGPRGIRALLDGMQHLLGWEPIMEGENIIGLADVTGGGAISLEPGGQFELSGAPVETVHQTCNELMAHLAQVREVARPLGIGFLGIGMTPRLDARRHAGDAEGPLQDHDGLHAEGRHARPRHDVPDLHGADQPRLLLRSRHGEEAAGGARACSRSRPRCSPIRRSPKASPTASSRSARRSGATPTMRAPACCPGCSRPAWASSATPTTRSTCRCISSSAATAISTCPASRSAITSPASSICRASARRCRTGPTTSRRSFRRCGSSATSRCAAPTAGRGGVLPSLPAFWVGILYDDDSLDAAWDIVKDWTAEERQKLRDDVPRLGFKATIRNRDAARPRDRTLRSRDKGLVRRKRLDHNGRDETRYLRPLEEIVARGITPAEELLANIHGRGTARSIRSTPNTPTDRLRPLLRRAARFRQVVERRDDVLGERVGQRRGFRADCGSARRGRPATQESRRPD